MGQVVRVHTPLLRTDANEDLKFENVADIRAVQQECRYTVGLVIPSGPPATELRCFA